MDQTFRVGVVGPASSYSLHYGEMLKNRADVEFVGIAHLGRDPEYIRDSLNLPWLARYPKTVEDYARTFQCELYERAEELMDEGALDAVCICTEDYLHQHYALMAVERGLHVFVPKPFARTREEAESMFKAANERGVILVGSLPHRFQAPSVTARQAIDEGAIGRPISGHFSIEHHLTLGGWKSDPTVASGPEYEIGFYVFDLMRMMMGSEPVTVMGYGANLDHRGIPYIDTGKCIVQCQNGALASIDLVLSMHQRFPPAGSMYVIGDEGALTIERDPGGAGGVLAIHTRDGVERRPIPTWSFWERELYAWLDLCLGRGDPSWWQEEGLRTLDLISAYIEAYTCCGVVTLTPGAPEGASVGAGEEG